MVLFEARIDGVLAGGAAVVVHDGVAHLFATSTLPAHRRRGVHTALVRARLAHARDAGADLATVVTDAGGASQHSLERASGFRVGYARVIFSAAPPLTTTTAPDKSQQPPPYAVERPETNGALMV